MTTDRAGYGVLTEESFERSRKRIGVPLRINPAHITEVSADATRHFAYGYGDDNPLYCDPEYGKNTRWGGLIAPPNFTYCMGENAAPPLTAEQKEVLKGDPFAGLGSYQAAMEFEYYRPLVAGDRCQVVRAQVGVEDKPSRFGGRTAHVTHDFLYANGHGQVVTIQRGTWINAERHTSKDRSEERSQVSFDPYTDDQIAEIDAAYDAEARRGAQTRYFEDVEVGEEIQPRVKGPLVITDLVVWHLGWGMQLTPPGAFGVARKILSQPAFDDYNGGELSPGPEVATEEQILDWVRRDAETALHPSCTAAMGTGERSVVDPATMQVHGLEGLRVVDASAMPYVTNGNIYAPVMMIAEKAADLILGNTPLPPSDAPFYRHQPAAPPA